MVYVSKHGVQVVFVKKNQFWLSLFPWVFKVCARDMLFRNKADCYSFGYLTHNKEHGQDSMLPTYHVDFDNHGHES